MPVAGDDEVIAAARTLIASGVGTVIVTLGAAGALAISGDEVLRVAPVAVTPRDTTGAGDAFIGAFARVWAETRDLPGALADAALYAADSVTRPGARTSYASVEAFAALKAARR
jgi:ribokinase